MPPDTIAIIVASSATVVLAWFAGQQLFRENRRFREAAIPRLASSDANVGFDPDLQDDNAVPTEINLRLTVANLGRFPLLLQHTFVVDGDGKRIAEQHQKIVLGIAGSHSYCGADALRPSQDATALDAGDVFPPRRAGSIREFKNSAHRILLLFKHGGNPAEQCYLEIPRLWDRADLRFDGSNAEVRRLPVPRRRPVTRLQRQSE